MIKLIGSTFSLTLFLTAFSCLVPLSANAQITADGTTSTIVNQNGNDFTIEQGSRIGDNLFHSFEDFSVPTLGSAVFNNASDIANIFSRVTGSNISNIDGLLGANGTANLYLINPNGIVFGQNARLNLGGSFFASTADSLLFQGNTEFSASNPQVPTLLEVNIPIGLNFRDNPGEIVNRSSAENSVGNIVGLEVTPGKNFTLVGGNIRFDAGNTTASGGKIELSGLSEAGIVGINDDNSLNFPENIAKADITLSNTSDVDVRGTGGGNITINARNLNLEVGDFGRSFIRAGITADSTSSQTQAGYITISTTNNVTVDESTISNQVNSGAVGDVGDVIITTGSLTLTNGGFVSADTLGQGNAGGVKITTGNLILTNGGVVSASTSSQGNAGQVTINASDNITIDDEDLEGFIGGVASEVNIGAEGDGGNVTITTSSLTLTNGGAISASTFGKGNAGSVKITASDNITIDGGSSVGSNVNQLAEGNSGGVTITTNSLTLTNGGAISASTLGQGNAGQVTINTSDKITIDGEDSDGFPSGVGSTVFMGAKGDAGDVIITTDNLTLTDGGVIDVSTFSQGNAGLIEILASDAITIDGESGITSAVNQLAEGNSKGITITTSSLTLTNGGRVDARTLGKGNAGLVQILASDTITIDGESGITSAVNQLAEGNSKGVTINTNSLTLTNGGVISANTLGQGNAGQVTINASETITIDGEDSDGFPSGVGSGVFTGAKGDAGDVIIATDNLTVINGGAVSVSTFSQGNAGLVEITANDIIIIDGENSDGVPSGISSQVSPGAEGNTKGITITTSSLTLTNGGRVDASTLGKGNAGLVKIIASDAITIDGEDLNGFPSGVTSTVDLGAVGDAEGVTIKTGSLSQTNGGRVSASTFGQGNAGDVTVNARETIEISGRIEFFRSGISADAFISSGNGGDVNVLTNRLTIDDGGTIEATNFDRLGVFIPGTGEPGNISIQANSLSLSNQGSIEAATQSEFSETAIINLTIAEDIILENNSLISATALGNAKGGNITINADDGSIVAFPNQNNDIIANADRGNGGDINITTQAIFGLEERPSIPPNQTNDIDASSQFGLQGDFSLNTPNVDPASGLIELPDVVGDASDQVSQNPCEQGVGSEFLITGKGGLPTNPNETLNNNKVRIGLVDPVSLAQKEEMGNISPEKSTTSEAIPAQGWIFNDKGEVMLTSYKTTNTEIKSSRQRISNSCAAF
ncbi:MAG: filamentous hemagglutinin N-terminal domain-containing protein [Cyanobacteria bacterium P01_F01_bin.143]